MLLAFKIFFIPPHSLQGPELSNLGVVLFVILWTVAVRLLCPWDFPGKNTGVGCHLLLPIFPTQE